MPDRPTYGRWRNTGPRTRTFIAIGLSEELKTHIAQIQEKLQRKNLPVIWENPQSTHITLLFLGHIAQERLSAAYQAMRTTLIKIQPFKIQTGPLEYFYTGEKSDTSIVYLSIQDRERELQKLFREITNSLRTEEFSPPHRLKDHITIGRLKKQRDRNIQTKVLESLTEEEFPTQTIQVDQITFYEVMRTRKDKSLPGQVSNNPYKPLQSYKLGS